MNPVRTKLSMKYFSFVLFFLLFSCSTLRTGNPALDAIYSGTAAVIKSDGVSSKCEQGHSQDRVNCRKRKQSQVNELDKSIKRHSKK